MDNCHRSIITDRLRCAIAALIAKRRASLPSSSCKENIYLYEAGLKDLGR